MIESTLLVAELTRGELATIADRMNLITGTLILSWGIYLRFVAGERVGWIYEYVYLITGTAFIVRGLVSGADPSIHVSFVRLIKQMATVSLGWVMFRYMIGSTEVKSPSYRIPQVVQRLREEGINGRRVNYKVHTPLGRESEDDEPSDQDEVD